MIHTASSCRPVVSARLSTSERLSSALSRFATGGILAFESFEAVIREMKPQLKGSRFYLFWLRCCRALKIDQGVQPNLPGSLPR